MCGLWLFGERRALGGDLQVMLFIAEHGAGLATSRGPREPVALA